MKSFFILFIFLFRYSLCSTSSSSPSTCIATENSSSQKWCRTNGNLFLGYTCSTSEYTSECGGGATSRCSTDNQNLPQNAKKLLCPSNFTACDIQYTDYSTLDDSPQTLASNYFDSNTLCWYKFISSTSDLISFDLNLDYLVRASAEVYLESSTDVFSYIGDLAKQGSMTVKVNYLNAVWVLSVPTGVGAAISITTYGTFTYSEDSGVDTMFVIGVLLIIAAIIIVICTISYFIYRYIKLKRIKEARIRDGGENVNTSGSENIQNLQRPRIESEINPLSNSGAAGPNLQPLYYKQNGNYKPIYAWVSQPLKQGEHVALTPLQPFSLAGTNSKTRIGVQEGVPVPSLTRVEQFRE